MKFLPIAAAAMLLTAPVFAQDTATPSGPEAAPATDAPAATPGPDAPAGDAGSGSGPTMAAPADQAPGGQVMAGQGVGGNAAANTSATVAPGSYPTCSRTVKDGCVQAAGRTRSRRR